MFSVILFLSFRGSAGCASSPEFHSVPWRRQGCGARFASRWWHGGQWHGNRGNRWRPCNHAVEQNSYLLAGRGKILCSMLNDTSPGFNFQLRFEVSSFKFAFNCASRTLTFYCTFNCTCVAFSAHCVANFYRFGLFACPGHVHVLQCTDPINCLATSCNFDRSVQGCARKHSVVVTRYWFNRWLHIKHKLPLFTFSLYARLYTTVFEPRRQVHSTSAT